MLTQGLLNFLFVLLDILIITSTLWLPLLLAVIFWRMWIRYIENGNLASLSWVMLHVRVPREFARTPEGMEIVLTALYQTGGTGEWYHRWWQGKTRAYFSLEYACIEGNIYMFIRTEKRFAELITSYLYSQYPQCEVSQVEDYTKYIEGYRDGSPWKMAGVEFKLNKADALPIKTYIDYALDKTSGIEENQRIDPLAAVFEYMSTLKAGEQIWVQILIMPSYNRYDKPEPVDEKEKAKWYPGQKMDWTGQGKIDLEKFLGDTIYTDPLKKEKVFNPSHWNEVQKGAYNSFTRNLQKKGFDTGIRAVYFGKGEAFDMGRFGNFLTGMFRNFDAPYLNSFGVGKTTGVSHGWSDLAGIKQDDNKKSMYKKFVNRTFFYPLADAKPFVLTTEELATLFHLPGSTIEASGIRRIEAKKAEAPLNLPF